MPNAADFLSQKPVYILLVNGPPDAGKTDLALTFPKNYVIACDPAGLEFLKLKQERSQKLAANLVHLEPFNSEMSGELKDAFRRTDKPDERDSIYGIMAHIKQLAKEGAIETVTLDGLTYFVGMKWEHLNINPPRGKSGEVDRFAVYDALSIFLGNFIRGELLTMATRQKLNVVITCHIQRESDEAMERKIIKDSDIAPRITGGFRNTIEGLPGAVIYLEHKLSPDGKLTYLAYCKKIAAMQTIIQAKNKYGLPAKIDITGKFFYDVLVDAAAGKLPTATQAAKK